MLKALHLHRAAQLLHRRGIPVVPALLAQAGQVLFGANLGVEAEIGAGAELGFGGSGVVVHGAARLGRNVKLGPHVVISGRSGSAGAPVIEDDVRIGAGACVLRDVRVGRGACIGANSVVVDDVPAGATVVGVPARRLDAPEETLRRVERTAEAARMGRRA